MSGDLDRYLANLQKILDDPTIVEQLVVAGHTFDMASIIGPLYDAFGLPRPIERYEEMTEEDKKWLRDIGIEP